jgi:hypothetical protein
MFVESARARHTQRAGKRVRVPATPDSKWRFKKKQISTDKIEIKSMTETQLTIDSDTYYYETLLPMQGGRLPGINYYLFGLGARQRCQFSLCPSRDYSVSEPEVPSAEPFL